MKRRSFDHEILLFQGGGALGAYQAGVYEGLAEGGMTPNWYVGISIGAVNSAILAGNPPERRVERLRAFWDRVSAYAPMTPPAIFDAVRPFLDRLSVWSVATFGIPGFFVPRVPPPLLSPCSSPGSLSFYDTAPLQATLEELVDFDLINQRTTRLSLGAVNVRTGRSVYFDNQRTRIEAKHVLASGALPPGFPAVEIDGEQYWDGGLVSNTPLNYVWDEKPLNTALIIQVNLFPGEGELPGGLDEVMERAKDIQFCSKQRFNTEHVRRLGELHAAIGRVLAKLPAEFQNDPDVQLIAPHCDDREWTIAYLTNSHESGAGQMKDAEFSRASVNERWAAGLEDIRRSIVNFDSAVPMVDVPGIHVYNLPPKTPVGK